MLPVPRQDGKLLAVSTELALPVVLPPATLSRAWSAVARFGSSGIST